MKDILRLLTSTLFILMITVSLCAQEESKASDEEEAEIFTIVEIMPEFKEGKEAQMEFLYSQLKYPAEARINNISGLVVISFIVEVDGSLTDYSIKREIGGGCGEEAMRVVKLMDGMWNPGTQRGKAVRVAYNLPVRFKLEELSAKELKKAKRRAKRNKN